MPITTPDPKTALLGRQPGDVLIARHAGGAFVRTRLEERLKTLGVTQVVIDRPGA